VESWVDAMLGVLGTTALLLDNGPDDTWGKPRERAVLATLVVHAGQVVPIDKLLRWVWPQDKPMPQNPGPTFNTYATRIRRALERLPSPPKLRAGQGGYTLEMDRSLIDFHQFRDLVAEARKHVADEPSTVVDMVDAALWLWRGLPLADLASAPALAWRERMLQNEWLAAQTIRVQALLDLGRHDEVIAALDDVQADYPNDVQLATLRLTALYGRRRFEDATRYYLVTRRRFRDDGDDQAAHHLRQHYATLAADHTVSTGPQPTAVPRQLQHDVLDFVGRREQLAALDEVGADQTGVLILDGPGGVGKTALAVHWAHRVRSRFVDGDLFVDLCGFSDRATVDPATVVDDFLVALGQSPDPTLSRRQREQLLSRLLADRRTLVVLDNARDTAQVRNLVAILSSSLVIVTSRQRLSTLRAATGARRISVPPMTTAESAELLSVQARSRIADDHRLVDLCGGLPLMITVLAEDLAGRTAAQLVDFAARLNRRKLLVAVGEHGDGAPPGAACFAASYRALAVPERRLFRLLSLHPGPDISAEAAYACDGRTPTETMRSLVRLTGANVLQQNELERYRLHDLLAEFGAQRLDADESPAARHTAHVRMLDFYVAAATEAAGTAYSDYVAPPNQSDGRPIRFADAAEALTWFHRERTNLTAVIRQAHETSCYDHVWRLADPVAMYFARSGCTIEAKAVHELAASAARLVGDAGGEASALLDLGMALLDLGELDQAKERLDAALSLVEAAGLDRGIASVLHQLGRLATVRGDSSAALRHFSRGLAIAESIEDFQGVSWFHCGIGRVLRGIDRHDEARTHLHKAEWQATRIGERSAEASCLVELGALFRELGDHATAAGYCERALAISEGIPDLAEVARFCVLLCDINRERRHFDKAVRYGRRAVEVLRGSQNLASQADAAEKLGDALHESGERDEAVLVWRQAADLHEYTGAVGRSTGVHHKLDDVFLGQDRTVPLARGSSTDHRIVTEPPQWVVQPGMPHSDG
jgi:tetratricopeptide (TPR) repeat protein